ncbi:MAG TPA: alpha/beta hydrolase [Acidimicrobiales bacterium]|nr:alpha/beta hydrolase [Acidimicrobiales bacterium]
MTNATNAVEETMTRVLKRSVANRVATAVLGLPAPVLDRIAGVSGPVVVDGRALHPALVALLGLAERTNMTRSTGDVATRRAELGRFAGIGMPRRTDVRVTNRVADLGGVERPVRIYRPYGITGELPGIAYYHGGGWVTGDLDTHDGTCRLLAATARSVVVAVDYRLAPEDPFPAGVDDAISGYAWTVENARELGADPRRIGVMGDSAGGTLAAAVAQQVTRDPGDLPVPAAQALVYPATDANMTSRSHELFAEGFFLTKADIEWFRGHYLSDPSLYDDVRASPLLAPDLAGLPPAVVVTAGFDPLRDEGDAYAAKLDAAGVRVIHRCYDDMVHGFFGMGVLPGGMATAAEICAAMGALLHDD